MYWLLAWHDALEEVGIQLSVWLFYRKIGMSGGLFTNALLRETGFDVDSDFLERLQRLHAEAYIRYSSRIRLLPGALGLLAYLTDVGMPWAIATNGR